MAAHVALLYRSVAIKHHLMVLQRALEADGGVAGEALRKLVRLVLGLKGVAALDDEDLVRVTLARQALIGEVLQQVCALFTPDGSTVFHDTLFDGAVRLHMRSILDQKVGHQHEVLGDPSTGLGSQGRGQWVRFEPLIEVVLPQKGLEYVLF